MNRIIKIFVPSVLAIFLLQSCFVAKNYERPEVVNEKYFRTDYLVNDSINQQDTATIANLPWQEVFTDSHLQNHINKALAQNVDVRTALQNILISQSYVKQGKAGYFPTLDVGGNYTYSSSSENGQMGGLGRQETDIFQLSGNVSWEADIWGKIRSNYRAANATYLQSIAAHQTIKTQLISIIASTYYQLLALDSQKEVVEETITNREKSLETIKALKDGGTVTEVAVRQTEAQLINARAQLIDIVNNIRLYENSLCLLLGENPHAIERSKLGDQKINIDLETGVPAQLLSNRPDIMSSEFALINAFELTNVARSSLYPSFRVTAGAGYQSTEFKDLFNWKSHFLNLVGGLTQPIFQGRALRTNLEVAKARQEIAMANYEYSILNAMKEVSDALYTYEAQEKIIDLKRQEFENYDKATEYSEELLIYGMANYLEVLTARENALLAELSLVNARFSQLNSIIQLYKAVGGGWK